VAVNVGSLMVLVASVSMMIVVGGVAVPFCMS
jgi:hypothetical protein